jgi:DMSO/TMAO reductase YedYZ molybdopterin-dependent catalytic subunit
MMEQSEKPYGDEPHQSSPAGLIIRQKEPTNLEMPFDQVDSYLTPTELFYIRSHFPAPRIDVAGYRLRIDGAVRNPLALSYKEFREMPSETRTATLECAGNGRVFLVPQVRGAQWELGAVGNAEWTVCRCELCWSGPAWKTPRAKSCSKEPIAAFSRGTLRA